jgi:predicted CXXCH cytochrome family protein
MGREWRRWQVVAATLGAVAAAAAVPAGLVLARGFRASSRPPALEAAVARGVRDWAIPRREAARRNPLAVSGETLQQGRRLFLTRCAGCHGVDGGGRTQMGTHLYPRVPDLRSAATQALSDGELNYIIAYGVQRTGMPAWGTPHGENDAGIWKLVGYLRSLGGRAAATRAPARAAYVGSAACRSCHAAIYQRWSRTPMANVVRDPRVHPEAILPDLKGNHVAPFDLSQVALVYGSLWKQRYFTRIGGRLYPLGAQWEVGAKQWSRYHVPDHGADWWAADYPSDNRARPTGPTCDGCHSVGYDIAAGRPAEWNVGCERCHGPGSEHVARPTALNIVNPARMDAVAANDTCIQCHSQGRPLQPVIHGQAYDWPVGYELGEPLAAHWRLETCRLGQSDFYYFPDCTAHKNRMQGNDFVQSVMYRRGLTCFSCHDVHGTANPAQLLEPAEQLCLDCHGPGSANGPREASLEAHTHHAAASPGSRCIACHMPAIESEGVPGATVHAHTFRFIPPAMSARYGIPNPCTACHRDRSAAWAAQALRKWATVSPWRLDLGR